MAAAGDAGRGGRGEAGEAEGYIRLCFAFLSEEQIAVGVGRLAAAVRAARWAQGTH